MKGRVRAAVVAVALASAACASLWSALGRRADGIKMPHGRHVAAKVDCLTCHETIFDAEVLSEADLPREKVCLQCHRQEKEKGNCGFCHTEPHAPATHAHRERSVAMSHAKHLSLEKVNEDCRVCHIDLPEPARPSVKPPMAACNACHRHEEEYASATGPATPTSARRAVPLTGFSRTLPARNRRTRAEPCATCHDQTFCAECHARTAPAKVAALWPERVDRNFIHRGDFVGRHDVEARADAATCLRCHGTSFCESCHRTRGLSSLAGNPRDPHPTGFSGPALHASTGRSPPEIASAPAATTGRVVHLRAVPPVVAWANPHPRPGSRPTAPS
jgi:hypothetical protein